MTRRWEEGLVDRVLGIRGHRHHRSHGLLLRLLRQRPEHADRDSGLFRAGRFHDRAGRLRSGQQRHLHAGVRDQRIWTSCWRAARPSATRPPASATVTLESVGEIDTVLVSGVNGTLYPVLSGEIRHYPFGREARQPLRSFDVWKMAQNRPRNALWQKAKSFCKSHKNTL